MQRVWFNFSNDVKRSVRSGWIAGALLAALLCLPYSVRAEESVAPSAETDAALVASAPEIQARFLQKNTNGDTYQLGDRITLVLDVGPDVIQNQSTLTLRIPAGGSSLEDQGWYLDPATQLVPGSFRFVVSPLHTGKLTIPTLLVLKEDGSAIGRTNPLSIQVAEIKKTEEKPALLDVSSLSLPARYWILFGLIAILIGFLVHVFYRRWLKNRTPRVRPETLPPVQRDPDHVIAIHKLDLLYQAHPFRNENMKPIAFGISEILKSYFSARFQIDANESTTDEMIALLRSESLSKDALREIQILFHDLDYIKFTNENLGSQANETAYIDYKVKAQAIIQRWRETGGAR